MTEVEKKKLIFCRVCRNKTNHAILHKTSKSDSDNNGYDQVWWSNDYFMLQCLGCETVCLLKESSYSEDYDPETGQLEISSEIYPDPFAERGHIDNSYDLPMNVRRVYLEAIGAFNNKLPVLTSVGLRATVEAVCADKGVTKKDLKSKIDALVIKGFMTQQEADLLHLTRFMGNASAHEQEEPKIEELKTGLDIIEATLRNAYILPVKAAALAKYKKAKTSTLTTK